MSSALMMYDNVLYNRLLNGWQQTVQYSKLDGIKHVSFSVLTISADAAWEAGGRRNVERGHLFGNQGYHTSFRHLETKVKLLFF